MSNRRCRHCRRTFKPIRNPNQHYCAKHDCQKFRRRRWHHKKCKEDSDYQANKKRSQKSWCKRHPDYYQVYRQSHPDYCLRNKLLQRERNKRKRGKARENGEEQKSAKRNVLLTDLSLISIPDRFFPGQDALIAKRYASTPDLVELTKGYRHFCGELRWL